MKLRRIIIADDEKDERDVIQFLIRKYGLALKVREAANGRDALTALREESAEILFTDVKMPFMNGIELAGAARELNPGVAIIFFSGYDDFTFAKKAISLRAVNYLLKPVNPSEFQDTMTSLLEEMEQEERERESGLYSLKQHILYRLLSNTSAERLRRDYPALDISFLSRYTGLILLQADEPFFDSLYTDDHADWLTGPFGRDGCGCAYESVNLNPFQSVILLSGGEDGIGAARELHRRMEAAGGNRCYLSVSDPFAGPDEMAKACVEAESRLEARFFCPDQRVYTPEPRAAPLLTAEGSPEQDGKMMEAIENAVRFRDVDGLRQNADMLLMKYQNSQSLSHLYIRSLCVNLLRVLSRELPRFDEKTVNRYAQEIFSSRHFSEVRALLGEVLAELSVRLAGQQQPSRHVIHLVTQYIEEHYGEALSLDLLAEKIYLTPRYLSNLFIQETGCGINKYIKNMRMKKARSMLLDTNMKVQDICAAVGYSSVSYFCQSFREECSMTPDKFRQVHSGE